MAAQPGFQDARRARWSKGEVVGGTGLRKGRPCLGTTGSESAATSTGFVSMVADLHVSVHHPALPLAQPTILRRLTLYMAMIGLKG